MNTEPTIQLPAIPPLSSSDLLGQPVTNQAIRDLLEEVMWWHSDPTLGEYNGCDTDPCLWCECAKGFLAGTMKHDEIVKAIGRPNDSAQAGRGKGVEHETET